METTPGRVGETRFVNVKTACGTYVRPISGLACVFSAIFKSIFLAPVLGNVSYPLSPQFDVLMIMTKLQLKVSGTFSTNMTKDFNQLMSHDALDAPLCLAACCQYYCNLQEYHDSEKKTATTFSFVLQLET